MLKLIICIAIFRLYFVYFEQKNLYYPDKKISGTPKDWAIGYEEVEITTPDGKVLSAWFVPAPGASVTVFYCHGNAGNISHRLHKVEFFHDMGVNFFIFDYRGYGNSTGFPTESGIYKDTLAAYDYLLSRDDIDKSKIVVCGKSLGGAIATELCTKRDVAALILESSLASVEMRGSEMFPFLPMKLLTLQKYDALKRVKTITIPKLITHGRSDDIISFKHGEALFAAAAEPKKFLPFDGGHNDEVYVTSDAYKEELKKFFAENSLLRLH